MNIKNKLFLYEREEIATPWHYVLSYNYGKDCPKLTSTVHWHDYFEFEIVKKGEGIHIFNNNTYKLSRGCAHLLTPFDFHTIHPSDEHYTYTYCFNFDKLALPEEIMELIPLLSCTHCQFDDEECEEIFSEIDFLVKEAETEGEEFKTYLMTAAFTKIFIMFLRKCQLQETDSDPGCSTQAFHRAVAYVQYHFRDDIELNKLAKIVGLTPNYLGQLFKKQYGKTYNEFIKKMRLRYAKNLLKHSDYSVAEIGKRSGFKTTSYFIQCFKSEYNITPKQYSPNRKVQ